jgi:hypothetical protein
MMTSDMRRGPPKTFSDLKERNYTLLVPNEKILIDLIKSDLQDDER